MIYAVTWNSPAVRQSGTDLYNAESIAAALEKHSAAGYNAAEVTSVERCSRPGAAGPSISDARALELLTDAMRAETWSADTFTTIESILTMNGRDITTPTTIDTEV